MILDDDHLQLGEFYTNHMFAWADTTETVLTLFFYQPTDPVVSICMYVCCRVRVS